MLIQKAAELRFPLLPGMVCNIPKKKERKRKHSWFTFIMEKKACFEPKILNGHQTLKTQLMRKLSSWRKSAFIAQEIEKGR